jgi:hypothetical protein|tara:strand:- start:6588 stop:7043 length:456 start_codon:yes stop_codon:yes gene_type:complete
MINLYVSLGVLLLLAISFAVFWAVRSYRSHKTNILVADELDKMIASTLKTIEETRTTAKRPLEPAQETVITPDNVNDMVNSPELLATIVTVLIHKFGDVRLSVEDFSFSDSEFVSVYLDSDTQELLLSSNKDLIEDSLYVGFSDPDDNTYH